MNVFLLLLLSHLLSDFLFQSKKVVKLKNKHKIEGFLKHGLIHFLVTFILLIFYGVKFSLYLTIFLTMIHLVIDWLKENVNSNNPVVELNIFFLDQLIHFLTIFMICLFIEKRYGVQTVIKIDSLPFVKELAFDFSCIEWSNILYIIIFYIFVMYAGAVILEKVLNLIKKEITTEDDDKKVGRYIGIVERALILTLVTFGSTSSLAFVLTAKSLARFNRLNDKSFAEYYLFGTLTSMLIALIGGLLLKNIISPNIG